MEKGDADLATVFETSHDGKHLPALTVAFYWSEMLKAVQVVHEQGMVCYLYWYRSYELNCFFLQFHHFFFNRFGID